MIGHTSFVLEKGLG